MGFKGIRHWVESAETGKSHIVSFRKLVAGAATNAGDFIDYTYFSGSPVANFYASAPLEAALVESDKGLRLPQVDDQWVKQLTVMSAASSATSTTNQNQTVHMLDYLMYYPFIDTDAVGEVQYTIPSVELPRYTTGIEKSAKNWCLNSDFKLGTVAGTPGTAPTNWSISGAPTGCQRSIDFGADAYGDYLEVRYWGTSSVNSYPSLTTYNINAGVKQGDTVNISAGIALVDGTWPSTVSCGFDEKNAGGGYLQSASTSIKALLSSSVPYRVSATRTVQAASVGLVDAYPIAFYVAIGEVIDFTFRIYEPMFVKQATPAPYAKSTTTNGVATWTSKGEGVRVMAISQSAAALAGTFTFTYTNQDGVPNRIGGANSNGALTYMKPVNGGGVSVSYHSGVTASSFPFLVLNQGDTGIQSIESVSVGVASGGLMALVLVKPLMTVITGEECRTTTSGNIESFGSASQIESVIHRQPAKIEKGAVVGFIGCGNNGSLASSILTGVLETQWS